jgi:hypothetical protein
MASRAAKTKALAKIKQHYSSKRRQTLSPTLWSNLPNDLARLILKRVVHDNKSDRLNKLAKKLLKTYAMRKRQYDVLKRKAVRMEASSLLHDDPLMYYELYGPLMRQQTQLLSNQLSPVMHRFYDVMDEMLRHHPRSSKGFRNSVALVLQMVDMVRSL